ncbi:LexA family protein [Candidatus Caldatribacterium sp.]|uniref:LexA family protein n=1 Tax=Candidatus Caldatribacterium sp. TaxID=2282143 RepID=UPI0029934E39|nr:helix-turn-helix domain-containing protein [Candidatus Caldatribacterium sp.]MDW8081046.1 S24 family peptidase [Candidatus Calescibacterium sp.]
MVFREWLRGKLKERGLTQLELARLSGVSQAAISRWLRGVREPDEESIVKVARALGAGEEEIALLLGLQKGYVFSLDDKDILVPLLSGEIPCGTPVDGFEEYAIGIIPLNESLLSLRIGRAHRAGLRLFAVRARGDSMIGKGIADGDFVVFSPDLEVQSGDIAVVNIENEGLCVKQVLLQGNTIVLQSANPAYPPLVFVDRPVRIVGKVIMSLSFH